MATCVFVLLGTKKGVFILESDASPPTGRCAARSAKPGRSTT